MSKSDYHNIPHLHDSYEISIVGELGNLGNIEKELRNFLERNDIVKEDQYFIALSFNEAVINIINHAYKGKPEIIDLEFLVFRNKVILRIRDYGPKLDPRTFRGRKLDDLKPSGLGLYLMRTFMDEVTYLTGHPTGTELLLIKHFPDKGDICEQKCESPADGSNITEDSKPVQ